MGWHEIRLTGFNYDDARAYLEWRFRQQGLETFPFTDTQVREIVRLSEGIPGRMDQMANVLQARIQSAGSGSGGYRFPPLHRAVLAVLVVALAFLYLIWQPEPDPVETARGPGPEAGAAAGTETPRAATAPPPASTAASPTPAPETSSERSPEGAADPAPGTQPVGTGPGRPESGPEAEVVPAGGSGEAEEATDSDPPPDPVATAPASPVAPPAPAQAPVAESRAAGSATTAASATPAGTPGPGPEVTPESQADADGPQNANWIMRQPAASYTLQLVSFSTEERADEYLSEQDHAERFARYRLQRDGRILHVVIYGSFADRAAAQEAAADMPDSVGSVQPWIRTFSQIQAGVRTALQR